MEFRVSAADASVQAWYSHALSATGMPDAGLRTPGRDDFTSVCLDFGGRPAYGPEYYQPEVDVGLEKLSPHATIVVYHV